MKRDLLLRKSETNLKKLIRVVFSATVITNLEILKQQFPTMNAG